MMGQMVDFGGFEGATGFGDATQADVKSVISTAGVDIDVDSLPVETEAAAPAPAPPPMALAEAARAAPDVAAAVVGVQGRE